MNYIAYGVALFISLILPILLSMLVSIKSKTYIKPIIVGVLTFLLFQVFSRIYIIQNVLSTNVDFIRFTYQFPIVYVFLLSVSAGLFEEIGRYIMMKYLLKTMNLKQALAFGLGHGGIEAILFVGLTILMIDPNTMDVQSTLLGGIERLSAMILHLGFSVLVYQMVFKSKKYHLVFSIILHTLVNFGSVLLMMNQVNYWIIEGLLALCAFGMILYIQSQRRMENETITTVN